MAATEFDRFDRRIHGTEQFATENEVAMLRVRVHRIPRLQVVDAQRVAQSQFSSATILNIFVAGRRAQALVLLARGFGLSSAISAPGSRDISVRRVHIRVSFATFVFRRF